MKNTRVYLALCAFLCFSVRAFSQDILQDSDAATIQDAVSSLPFFEGTVMNPRLEINDVEPQPVHMLTSDENISEVCDRESCFHPPFHGFPACAFPKEHARGT